MPDLAPDETLHDVWAMIGKSGQENAPLSWQEIDAYLRRAGDPVTQEEARILREMSEAYCGELRNLSPFARSPIEKAELHG